MALHSVALPPFHVDRQGSTCGTSPPLESGGLSFLLTQWNPSAGPALSRGKSDYPEDPSCEETQVAWRNQMQLLSEGAFR